MVRGKSNTSPLFNSLVRDQVIQELQEEEEGEDSVELQTISENDSTILHTHNLISNIDHNSQIQLLYSLYNAKSSHLFKSRSQKTKY